MAVLLDQVVAEGPGERRTGAGGVGLGLEDRTEVRRTPGRAGTAFRLVVEGPAHAPAAGVGQHPEVEVGQMGVLVEEHPELGAAHHATTLARDEELAPVERARVPGRRAKVSSDRSRA